MPLFSSVIRLLKYFLKELWRQLEKNIIVFNLNQNKLYVLTCHQHFLFALIIYQGGGWVQSIFQSICFLFGEWMSSIRGHVRCASQRHVALRPDKWNVEALVRHLSKFRVVYNSLEMKLWSVGMWLSIFCGRVFKDTFENFLVVIVLMQPVLLSSIINLKLQL